jgi:hypothetical protein
MKRWVFLALAILIVLGAGVLLLHTRQAPLVTEAETAAVEAPEPAPMPAPVSDTAAPAAPVKHLSTEEFRALGAAVMQALPTKADLRKLSDAEAHETPAPIITAGIELGKIAQAVADDPALEAEAITLYRECAVSPQHPDSVRALCYSDYKRLAKKTGADFDEHIVKRYLRDLADRLDQ